MSAAELRAGAPAWLHDFCGRGARQELAQPWSVDLRGGRYTVATNGHRMIALAGDLGYPSIAEHAAKEQASYPATLAASIVALLSASDQLDRLDRLVGLDLYRFRAFLQRHVKVTAACAVCCGYGVIDCEVCDGEGLKNCCQGLGEHPCVTCGDDGRELTRVQIGLGQFNARLFARPIGAIAGDLAHWHQESAERPATLRGAGWRLIVSPMKPGVAPSVGAFSVGGVR